MHFADFLPGPAGDAGHVQTKVGRACLLPPSRISRGLPESGPTSVSTVTLKTAVNNEKRNSGVVSLKCRLFWDGYPFSGALHTFERT